MKQPSLISRNELQQEINRIDAQITKLRAERDVLQRLMRRYGNEAEPPPLPGSFATPKTRNTGLSEAVVNCVNAAPPSGLKVADIIATVSRRGEWQPGSIRSALYLLRGKGLIHLEGHWWKPATQS